MNRSAGVVASVVMLCAVSITCADQAPNVLPTTAIDVPGQDTTVARGEQVNFQGSADDGDGSVASHAWDFGDGNGATVEDPGAYTYVAHGIYTVTYQVTDDNGATSIPDSVVVKANQVPTAVIDNPAQDTTARWPYAVTFHGTASDVDGTIVSHRWDFGDGNEADVEDPGPYAYTSEGTYTVTYEVTDDDGAVSSQAALQVTVVAEGIAPEPGHWFGGTASDHFGLFGVTVNAQGTAITEIAFSFEDWQCGGTTRDGRIGSSVPGGWRISGNDFTIESSFAAIGLAMTIHGTFDSNTGASGTWTGVSSGTTCSGQWQLDKQPPSISVSVSPDFESQGILGRGWITGRQVTLEIDNGADGTIDFQATTRVDGGGVARFSEGAAPYAVAEGDSISMYDAVNLMTYTVLYVTLDLIDTVADLVSGSARAGTQLMVGVFDPSLLYSETWYPEIGVTADATGTWTVSFAGIFDILPGTPGWVHAISWGRGNTAIHW